MKKNNNANYICNSCGTIHSKWVGRCDNCGEWNSLYEESKSFSSIDTRNTKIIELKNLRTTEITNERITTNIKEFDQVCGGGLVPGSAILLGGASR